MFLSELKIKFTPWFYLMDWLTTIFCLELTIWLHNRLTLGLCPSWKRKRFTILGVEWSYEIAMICKGYECALEAGFQTLLQVYIQMQTQWIALLFWRDLVKAYMEDGGNIF